MANIAKHEADGAAGQRQRHCFDDLLERQPSVAAAEGCPNRQVAAAGGPSQQEEQSDVRAGDDEQEEHGSKRRPQRGRCLSCQPSVQRFNPDAIAARRVHDRVQLGPGRRGRDARLQTREAVEAASRERHRHDLVRDREGKEELVQLEAREHHLARENADHGHALVVHLDPAPQRAWVSTELAAPEGVADDCHWLAAGEVFASLERPATRWSNAQRGEHAR